MARGPGGLLPASGGMRTNAAYMHSPTGRRLHALRFILKMGVHAAKGELLSRVLTCLFEGVVHKSPIVAMIVLNFHAVVSGKLLEGMLGFDCFGGTLILHQMYESQVGEMVNEDGSAVVTAIGKFSFELRVKTNLR